MAEDDTLEWMLERLQRTSSAILGEPLLSFVDSYLGIPPTSALGWICGNSTPEEVAEFFREQDRAFAKARAEVLRRWQDVRPVPS